ncbi:MAG: lysylphosphatidylglycerol synthase transmembrane domain-containing protein [Desulfatibacillaceae bacterium]
MNKKSLAISFVVGAAISAVGLYYAFLQVPIDTLGQYLREVNYWWLIPATGVVAITFVLRTVRWQLIMRSIHRLDFSDAYHPLIMGFGANCILPGRVGELVRPALMKREKKVPFFGVFATVATERVFDLAVLLALLVGTMAFIEVDPGRVVQFAGYELDKGTLENVAAGMVRLAAVLLVGMILVSVTTTRQLIQRMVMWSPSALFFLPGALKEKLRQAVSRRVVDVIHGIAKGFALLHSAPLIAACAGLTILIWVFSGAIYWVVGLGTPDVGLDFPQFMAVMVLVCFFIALPSVPGFWGLWEAGGMFAMGLFGVPAREALGFTLVCHVVQIFPVIVAGLVSAVIKGVSIWQVVAVEEDAEGGEAPA